MEWVETTGRTVTEALETALDRLGVDEQEAEIQILDEPRKGLFGRLRVEARVRARVRPTAPRAKADRRDRRRRNGDRKQRKGPRQQRAGSRTGEQSGGSGKPHQSDGSEEVPARAGKSSSKGPQRDQSQDRPPRSQQEGEKQTSPAAAGEASSGAQGQRSGSSRKRRRRSGGGGSQQGAKVAAQDSEQDNQASPSLDVEPQKEAVDRFLGGLMTALGRPEATVTTATADGDTIVAEVHGEELGLLVGPKGQTLQAVHELTRSVVQRQFVGESHARLQLDVGGYRKRRAEALARFTQDVASEVLESGQAKALEPMSASDRKVVHDAVNEIEGVRTFSEGEEPARRVVVEKS